MSLSPKELVQYHGLFMLMFVLGIGGSFQYGFHISVINSPSQFVKSFINDTWMHRYDLSITDNSLRLLWSFIVSSYCIGGLVGSLGSGYLSSKYGKKRCLLCGDVIPMVAALLMGLSTTAKSFEMILIARFLYGINAGLGLNIHSQYAGEIADKKLRGFTSTSISIFVTIGKLAGQLLGLREILGIESQWCLLLALSGFWALAQMVTLPFFPESPPYLLMEKKDKDGCIQALKQLWGDRDHQKEIDEMLQEQASRRSSRSLTVVELLREHSLRWQLYMLLALTIALQLCGMNAVYFYAVEVFKAAGFQDKEIPYLTVGIGACESASVILCALIVDHLGKRRILLAGYASVILSLGLLTLTISLQDMFSWMPYCSVILLFMYTLSFGIGASATTIPISLEIFSQEARAAAMVIVGVLNWLGLTIIGMVFPFVVATMEQFCFLIFLFITAVCGTFLYFYLPETKGKSWMQIKEDFNKYNFKNQLCIKDQPSVNVISTRL
ncbi:solute carrier family 2, facilitated glucose transporter member 5-like [Bufo gargarizans]|uniref:solute carrier family 2, facilitated glucose transporter member 5-like n=1 Tax=Bufo gargarizans TaxID=30331 RepID=UPI001CF4F91C|nr:solute carrier family 2, facilitated glucose transporter member 5-like [Bufo gargarizans]